MPPCALAAHVAEVILKVVHRRRPLVNDQLIALHLAEQLVDEDERQLDLIGDFSPRRIAAGEEKLHHQRFDDRFRQAGGGERFRLDGEEDVGDGDFPARACRSLRGALAADLLGQRPDPLEHRAQLLIRVRGGASQPFPGVNRFSSGVSGIGIFRALRAPGRTVSEEL